MDDETNPSKKFAGGCGYLQPHYAVVNTVMMISFPEGGEEEAAGGDRKRPMAAEEALTILRRISDKDVVRMGFNLKENHPKNLIITHMAIPPPHVRPTISFGAQRSEEWGGWPRATVAGSACPAFVRMSPVLDVEALSMRVEKDFWNHIWTTRPRVSWGGEGLPCTLRVQWQ